MVQGRQLGAIHSAATPGDMQVGRRSMDGLKMYGDRVVILCVGGGRLLPVECHTIILKVKDLAPYNVKAL